MTQAEASACVFLFIQKKKSSTNDDFSIGGGPEEIRTLDPHNANVMRSQLRYRPMCLFNFTVIYYNTKI